MTAARIVILALPGIGDILLAHSLLQLLKKQQPDAPVDVMVTPRNEEVARMLPEVRDVFTTPGESGRFHLRNFLMLTRLLKSRGYASSYAVHINPKYTLMPLLAGIPERVGFQKAKHSASLLTKAVPSYSPPDHFALEMAKLAEPGLDEADLPLPRLAPEHGAAERLPAELKELADSAKLVALCPGGFSHSHKRWPAAHHARLAAWLAERGFQVALLGSARDVEEARRIQAEACSTAIHDLTGRLKLAEAFALLSRCRALVSNDTGIMHAGAALGIVTLGVFTVTNPSLFHPLGPQAHHVAPPHPSSDPDAVPAKQVIDKLEKLL